MGAKGLPSGFTDGFGFQLGTHYHLCIQDRTRKYAFGALDGAGVVVGAVMTIDDGCVRE